jgi:uncharacterized damage-inducible protein DinB
MNDDFATLYSFDRWANSTMLDACRKLSPEQYVAEPAPGWPPVRFTVYHIAAVTDTWVRGLVSYPDQSFPAEAAVPTPDAAAKMLDRAYRNLDNLLPSLTPERLVAPQKFLCGGQVVVAVPWAVMRHVVSHATYHRGQVASKLKRFGIQQPDTDFIDWVIEQKAQKESELQAAK